MSHEEHKSLLNALYNCISECNHCLSACLDEDDVKMMANCIRLDMVCAEICTLTASLIARGSEHGAHLLAECAEVCKACADECQKHADMGIEHCRTCAEACRECAQLCEDQVAA